MLKTQFLATIALLGLISTASAGLLDLETFDFTGWDHDLLSNGGQTFEDICDDIDVTVTTVGAFEVDSTFIDTQTGSAIRTQQSTPGASHSFVFTFSEPLEICIDFTRLDQDEFLGFYAQGPFSGKEYNHFDGIFPDVMPDGSGIRLEGNGFGFDAANGQVCLGPTSVLTVSYGALSTATGTKFADFNISKVVPEPATASLLGLAFLGLMGGMRKRR
jgi:hypothetical protein